MVGIVSPIGHSPAAAVADLVTAHLLLLAAVDAIAAAAISNADTRNIGLQLEMAAGRARTTRKGRI